MPFLRNWGACATISLSAGSVSYVPPELGFLLGSGVDGEPLVAFPGAGLVACQQVPGLAVGFKVPGVLPLLHLRRRRINTNLLDAVHGIDGYDVPEVSLRQSHHEEVEVSAIE